MEADNGIVSHYVFRPIFSAFAGVPSMIGAQSHNPDPPADEAVYRLDAEFLRSTLMRAAFGSYIDEQQKNRSW